MELLKNPAQQAQLSRTLGYATAGGAEISECLTAAKKLDQADAAKWYDVWSSLADQLRVSAEEGLQKGYKTSSGQKLLRASNYYRTAYFFLEENSQDDRIATALKLSKGSFLRAMDLLGISYIPLQIPFEDYYLPAYLFLSAEENAPLLIDTGGGDSILEELYFISVEPALKRGYHTLIFEGPGQGSLLRLEKRPFRADWETVIAAVLDFMEKNYPTLLSKVALRGDSFGGYLAARAASGESRIQACVLNPGIKNPTESLAKLGNPIKRQLAFLFNRDLKFKIKSRFMRFGANSFSDLVKKCKAFTLQGRVHQIQCPTLVIDNEEEHLTQGQAQKLFFELSCKKNYHRFTAAQSTGGHCQPFGQMATHAIIFDWLDTQFGRSSSQ